MTTNERYCATHQQHSLLNKQRNDNFKQPKKFHSSYQNGEISTEKSSHFIIWLLRTQIEITILLEFCILLQHFGLQHENSIFKLQKCTDHCSMQWVALNSLLTIYCIFKRISNTVLLSRFVISTMYTLLHIANANIHMYSFHNILLCLVLITTYCIYFTFRISHNI